MPHGLENKEEQLLGITIGLRPRRIRRREKLALAHKLKNKISIDQSKILRKRNSIHSSSHRK